LNVKKKEIAKLLMDVNALHVRMVNIYKMVSVYINVKMDFNQINKEDAHNVKILLNIVKNMKLINVLVKDVMIILK